MNNFHRKERNVRPYKAKFNALRAMNCLQLGGSLKEARKFLSNTEIKVIGKYARERGTLRVTSGTFLGAAAEFRATGYVANNDCSDK